MCLLLGLSNPLLKWAPELTARKNATWDQASYLSGVAMREGLRVGSTGDLIWIVDPTMTITLGGLSRATIFSTPNMIMLMERAAREALRLFWKKVKNRSE